MDAHDVAFARAHRAQAGRWLTDMGLHLECFSAPENEDNSLEGSVRYIEHESMQIV